VEWSKVKNIVILILLAVNILLLGQTAEQERQYRKYQEEALDGAIKVLLQQGYEVEETALPKERVLFSLVAERDKGSEERFAETLLGSVSRTEEGVRSVYRGEGGSCWFRSDGSFSLTFLPGVHKPDGEKEEIHAQRLLTQVGYPCEVAKVDAQGEDSIQVTVRQTWEGAPIFSCTAELVYQNGELIEIGGVRLIGTPVREAEGGEMMDLPTALIRFMAGMREGGHVFTAIKQMTAGYQVASAGRHMELRPVWGIDTDVDTMLLDGLNGALSKTIRAK
jgi:hypothetical protein